ncbi:hypothetical protein [Undibacterium sp. Ji49W]|uniref:hypothetical protein n=1 Tax=Undibacterium sp. Ji49W TaxID=3413040 RepID=UPI003BF3DBDB
MSNTQFAFIQREQVPNRESLQSAIDQLGFDLQLDSDFTAFEDSGFSPCTLNGKDGTGFEISYDAVTSLSDDEEIFLELANGRDYCISLVWHSSTEDLACVMIVCCALAKYFDALISYEADVPTEFDDLLQATTDIVKELVSEQINPDIQATHQVFSNHVYDVTEHDVNALLASPNYYDLSRHRLALMELWANGALTVKQRNDLEKVETALHKLKLG